MANDEKTAPKTDTVSSLIRHLEQTLPTDEDITVGALLAALGVHGFVFFLLVLALLNIAIFMLPGLSILFGVPMVILCVQMLIGHLTPVFPAPIRRRKISSALLHKGLDHAVTALEKIQPHIKPRFLLLTHPSAMRVHILVALVMAFMVAIPVPFINLPPTFGMIMLTIGLLQRDGVFVACAYVLALWSLHLYESLGQAAQNLVG